jgi:hypothetical protein
MEDYPCEECALKEADIEDLLDQVETLRELVNICEKGLCKALSAKEKRVYLPVAKALAQLQKMKHVR